MTCPYCEIGNHPVAECPERLEEYWGVPSDYEEEEGDARTDGGRDVDEEEHPLDVATDSNKRVNRMLADTDGAICTMGYAGAIGYHINVAEGETDPEYLWEVALLQALDQTVFDMMFVDGDRPEDARRQVERELKRSFDPLIAERVAEVFETKLASLIEVQEGLGADGRGDGA